MRNGLARAGRVVWFASMVLVAGAAESRAESGSDLPVVMATVSELVFVPIGMVAGVGNGLAIGKGRRPDPAWLMLGYSAGGLNLAGGTILLAVGADTSSGLLRSLGIAGIVVGVADIVLAIWGHSKPTRSASLSPALLALESGRGAPGVAFTVSGF